MRTIFLGFLVSISILSFSTYAEEMVNHTGLTNDDIQRFNSYVSSAVSSGNKWPCSPLLLTHQFLGNQPAGLTGSREIFCRDGANDTSAVVTVRAIVEPGARFSSWFEMNYRKTNDNTWRLVSIDSLTNCSGEAPSSIHGAIPLNIPSGGKQIQVAEIQFDSQIHSEVSYTASLSGVEIELVGNLAFQKFWVQPDTTVPVAFPAGPSPYSIQSATLVLLSRSDISFSVRNSGLAEVCTISFSEVVPGPYLLKLGGPKLESGIYHIEVWSGGKAVSLRMAYVQ